MTAEIITPIGTCSWFALIIANAIRTKRWADLFVGLLFSMLIVDSWAVAPLALQANPNDRSLAIALWSVAVFPFVVIAGWALKSSSSRLHRPKG